MIYSRSAEYAIRAFVHLAQVQEGKYAMVKNIAEQEDIPAHFLAKILQQLARKGLLRSSKGPTGGFALRVDANEIRLLDIVEALDGLAPYQQCASGLSECNDDMPCSMHDSWVALRSRIMDYLGRNTIADLAKALDQKKKAIAQTKQRKSKRSVSAKRGLDGVSPAPRIPNRRQDGFSPCPYGGRTDLPRGTRVRYLFTVVKREHYFPGNTD